MRDASLRIAGRQRLTRLSPLLTWALAGSVFAAGWFGPPPTAKISSASAATVNETAFGGAHPCAVPRMGQARVRCVGPRGRFFGWRTKSIHSAFARFSGQGRAVKIRRCHGTVGYGPSNIKVNKARGVSCARAKRLARRAVIYRVNGDFSDRFCQSGYCWRFGDARGAGLGLSKINFTGRRGVRRIFAVQLVS